MKILIFVLVAVLCIQTIHASNTCRKKLDNLITDGLKFLANFKAEHDEDKARVQSIQEICNELNDYLGYYGNPQYGENISQEKRKTEVFAFVVGFLEKYMIVKDIFIRLINGINILEELAACLVAKYGLTCQERSNLRGCNADLNAASCALSPLTSAVPGAASQALDVVNYLSEEADILAELTRDLSSTYLLACDSCEDNLDLSAIRSFFRRFVRIHDEMHKRFLSLDELCEIISEVIDKVADAFGSL